MFRAGFEKRAISRRERDRANTAIATIEEIYGCKVAAIIGVERGHLFIQTREGWERRTVEALLEVDWRNTLRLVQEHTE